MNDEINDFYKAYRDYIDQQRDKGLINLENKRRNDFQSIMSGANTVGMMYSNFPKIAKIKYNTSTYEPAKMKLQETYQTGLDKLRSNIVNYINQLAEINEETAKLDETTATPLWEQDDIDYAAYNLRKPEMNSNKTGYNYFDAAGNPIKFGTYAKRLGAKTNQDIIRAAAKVDRKLAANLARIYMAQQNTSHPNFTFNLGADAVPVDYSSGANAWLNSGDNALLNSVGLGMGF